MTNFPDLSNLSTNPSVGNVLSLPNNSYPYFWLWIMGGLWLIISFTLYFKEKEKKGFGNILSSLGVASLAIIVLSTVGTMIGIITLNIMIYILVFCLLIIGVWIFSN